MLNIIIITIQKLILTYKIISYCYADQNMKTNKNDFIFSVNKNIKYDNTLKNKNLIYYFNQNSVKTFNKWIHQHKIDYINKKRRQHSIISIHPNIIS